MHGILCLDFFIADTQLYKRFCPSIGWSVRRGDRVKKWENMHIRPCPLIRNWWPCIRPCFSFYLNLHCLPILQFLFVFLFVVFFSMFYFHRTHPLILPSHPSPSPILTRRYRFRMIQATGTHCPVVLSVDNHELVVISTEGMPVRPQPVRTIGANSAERFDFIVSQLRACF